MLGPFVAVSLGAALAWLCRREAPREDDVASRARLAIVALFAALVYAPASVYFLVFAGDWAFFYLVDSRDIPSALLLLLGLADAALLVVGFAAGHAASKRRRSRTLALLAAAPATFAAGLCAAFLPALRVEGTFHQVTNRFGTQPLAGSATGWAVLWMDTMIAAGAVVAARALVEPPAILQPKPPAEPSERPLLLGRRRHRQESRRT